MFTYFDDPRRYNVHKVSVKNQKEKNILVGKIMLNSTLEKSGVSVGDGLNWLSIGPSSILFMNTKMNPQVP
jgi:hypothetical protein